MENRGWLVLDSRDPLSSILCLKICAASVPAAEVALMPASRHFPLLEETDIFNEVLMRFLEKDLPRQRLHLPAHQPVPISSLEGAA